jgi:hypothetical protein
LIIKNNFIFFFINILKNILNKFGYILVKKNKLNFDEQFNISNLNLHEINIINNYDLSNLITTEGGKLGSNKDLFYLALKDSLPIKNKAIFIETFSKKIKILIGQPKNVAQAIGLKQSKVLSFYPEWSIVLPWEDKIIDKVHNTYLDKFISKRKKLKKIYKSLSYKDKYNIVYSDEAWKSHAEQFYELYYSMIKKGFEEHNAIPVNLFKSNNMYKISIGGDGNHRIRTAHILNLKSVPLKISKLIDIQDLNNWTNVKNGLYSKTEAEQIFTDYFNYRGNGSNV